PQLAILVPIVAVMTIRRALLPPAPIEDDERAEAAGSDAGLRGLVTRIRAWERRTDRPFRILTTAAAGLLTAIVLCFPFGLPVLELNGDAGGLPVKSGL